MGCTPLFLKAEPQMTGNRVIAIVPLRIAALISADGGGLAPHVLLEQDVVARLVGGLGHLLDHELALLLRLVQQVGGNLLDLVLGAERLVACSGRPSSPRGR